MSAPRARVTSRARRRLRWLVCSLAAVGVVGIGLVASDDHAELQGGPRFRSAVSPHLTVTP